MQYIELVSIKINTRSIILVYCMIQHGGSCRKEVSKGGLAVVTRKTE